MNRDYASQRRLVESFLPPPLRLVWSDDPENLSTGTTATPTALLWLDLVGSTRLVRTMMESKKGGIDRLGSLLNKYFDLLLKTVVAHGGQPLMFAGDGLLSGWPCHHSEREGVLRAAQCAEDVLANEAIKGHGEFSLQLHAVLAFGACRTLEIPIDGVPLDVVVGSGLRDLQFAAQLRAPGRVVVSAIALKELAPVAKIASGTGGRGVLLCLHKRVVPQPLLIDPLPESIAQRIVPHVQPQIAISIDPYSMDCTPELRRVTSVFAGIRGIDWSDDDIESHLKEIAQALMPIVRKYDGFFHQLRIDDRGVNLMILFGTQLATHADNAARGVRAASDLKHALRDLGYRTSIAVATGPTLCSLMGNDIFRKHMIFGDAINLAARLKELSQGKILCDEPTMRRARKGITFEPLGDAYVEGIARPVSTWTPRQIGSPESFVRMEGREAELTNLIDKIRSVEPGKRTAVVLLEGEAGFGKSRLLSELRRKIATNTVRLLMSSANRIEQNLPYHGWRSIYDQLLGINQIDDTDRRKEKALQTLGAKADQSWYLNALLPLEFDMTAEIARLSGEQRARARLNLLLSLLNKAAQKAPLVLVIDDAHWLDEASWQLARQIAEEVPGICLILSMQTLQDETPCSQLESQGATRFRLRGLEDVEQERLICATLGVKCISPEVAKSIIDRAAGHPLYCMELTRTLREEGMVEIADGTCHLKVNLGDLPLPDSVSSTVQRRIDRLERVPKIILKLASVTGMQFPTSLVEHLCSVTALGSAAESIFEVSRHDVHECLEKNRRSGLLQADLVDDVEGYAFSHGIIRDVAYDLIYPLELKSTIHLHIADWYENRYPDRRSRARYHVSLAYHLERAGELRRSANYLMLEAERQFELGMAPEAVNTGLRSASLLLVEYQAHHANGEAQHFGGELADNPQKIESLFAQELSQIDALLEGRRPEELLELPHLPPEDADCLLELLTRLAPILFQSGRGDLFALLITTSMRITLEHGNGPMAPVVYSLYSIIAGGDPEIRTKKACWSQLALDLLGDERDRRFGSVSFIHGWFHNHWTSALAHAEMPSRQNSIQLSRVGADAAFANGDIQYAGYNLAACVIYMAAAGNNLNDVMNAAVDHLKEMDTKGRAITAEFHLKLELQMAKALAGLTRDWLVLTDEEYDQTQDLEWICDTDFDNQIGYYFVSLGRLYTHFGDWRGARAFLDRLKNSRLTRAICGQTADYERVQFMGLASLAEAAFGESADDQLVEEGESRIEELEIWDKQWKELNPQKSSMYDHKAKLLSGVKECAGRPSKHAAHLLKESAEAATAAGFLNDAVLAYEFLARCYRKAGQQEDASIALDKAIEVCSRWGAHAKAAFLQEEFGACNIKLVSSPLSPARGHGHADQVREPKEARKV